MIKRTDLDEVDYYSSAKEVALEDDRVQIDIHVIGWEKKLRIQALNFGQMERIDTKSTTDKGTMDHALWVYYTIMEGVIIPPFNLEQAKALADNNGHFVRELADEIWELGRISKKQWDAYIKQNQVLNEVKDTGNPDAATEDTTENE